MSRKIKERTKELANKEVALKSKLLKKSGGFKSKATSAGKTALIGGAVAILIYGLYKAFFQSESKPKKSKNIGPSTSGIVAEKVTTFLLPYLGKALDSFLERRAEKANEKQEETEEKE